MRAMRVITVLALAMLTSCNRADPAELQGSWTGPLGAVLKITDAKWYLSAGIFEVTLDYKVDSTKDDIVIVALKRESTDLGKASCRIDGKTLRITQPLNSTLGLGGTWTRQ